MGRNPMEESRVGALASVPIARGRTTATVPGARIVKITVFTMGLVISMVRSLATDHWQ
jgi:hypothetical protein